MRPPVISLRPRLARPLLTVLTALALAATGHAQRLADFLPADTFFALGAVGLDAHADVLDDFLLEWERLGVGPALEGALAGLGGGASEPPSGATPFGALPFRLPGGGESLPDELADLDLLELIGREAWLGLSVSSFNPLPALTLVASVDEATGRRFDVAIERAATESGALRLSEGAARFVVTASRDGVTLAATRFDDLLALSTNPDVLRAVLRQAQGSPDPSFGDGASFAVTLGAIAPGELYGFVDADALASALSPLVTGIGFDDSVERLRGLLSTIGSGAGVLRVVPGGLESESVQVLRGAGRDGALAVLLGDASPAPRQLLSAVPAEALSLSVAATHPRAWWDYLNDLVGGLGELAIPDLDRTLRDLSGVEVRRDLMSWTGRGVLTVVTGAGAVVEPGVSATQLLGDSVYVLVAEDERRAHEGLSRLLGNLGATLSAFTDPMGRGGAAATRERVVEGVTVTTYDLFAGGSVSVAITSGLAVIGTTEAGTDATVAAIVAGAELPPTLARLLTVVPDEATSFTLSDDRAVLEGSAAGLAAQVQLLAGLGGGSSLDFDAVVAATDALEAYLAFVAQRLGGSVSWSTSDGAALRSFGRTEVDWR